MDGQFICQVLRLGKTDIHQGRKATELALMKVLYQKPEV